jgi:hypothetical protein
MKFMRHIAGYHLLGHKMNEDKGKVKVFPVPFLTEHHAMKAYWGVEV